MRAATRQLKNDILGGKTNAKLFNKMQLDAIMNEYERIPGFTWHHHQEAGRMQLVPRDIHDWIKHIGGNNVNMWGAGK